VSQHNGNGKADADFLSLFLSAAGKSEIPKPFLEWAGVSLVAATLNDHVWYEKFPGKKLYPQLYVFLLGPSGLGKGEAIDFALQFIDEDAPLINIWDGKVSGEGFVDDLATISTDVSHEGRPTALLTMPELAQAIGKGQQADAFVKRMTGWYPPPRRRYKERTRTTGANIDMPSPLVNWLVGTTVEWMVDSITKDAIESGFFARVFAINCPYNLNNRVPDPTVEEQYPALCKAIRTQLRDIADLTGSFRLTKQARAIRHKWYLSRPAPEDTRLLPSWRRQDDLILKLCMVFSAMSGRGDMRITSHEITRAQQYVLRAHHSLPRLLSVAGQTPMTNGLNTVASFIKIAGRIPHSPLLKKLAHRGIHAQEASLHLLALMQQRDIECERLKGGARVYTWAGAN